MVYRLDFVPLLGVAWLSSFLCLSDGCLFASASSVAVLL